MRFDLTRRRRRHHPALKQLFASFRHGGSDVTDTLVVFRRVHLSRVRHDPFKEARRAIDRREERRFVRASKADFINAA